MEKIGALSLFRKGEQLLERCSNSVGISRRSPSGGIGYAICTMLLVFQCGTAEARGSALGEHSEQPIFICQGERMALHEPLSHSIHNLNALPPAVSAEGKMVANKVSGQRAGNTEGGHDAGIISKEVGSGNYPTWEHLACILAFGLACLLAGFFLSYPYPLRTREDWAELWRDVKFAVGF